MKQICVLWNSNKFDYATDLVDYCKIDPSTIRDYLNKGSLYGWCSYNGKVKMRKNGSENVSKGRRVYSKTLNKQFDSIKDLA